MSFERPQRRFAAALLFAIHHNRTKPAVNGKIIHRRGRGWFGIKHNNQPVGASTPIMYRLGWRSGKKEEEKEEKADFSFYLTSVLVGINTTINS